MLITLQSSSKKGYYFSAFYFINRYMLWIQYLAELIRMSLYYANKHSTFISSNNAASFNELEVSYQNNHKLLSTLCA